MKKENTVENTTKPMAYDALLYAVLTWYRRKFKVIDIAEAQERGLSFVGNVHGDEINYLNCRSIWRDRYGKGWRVKQLG